MDVYLDYNATTPVDPRVHAAMQPWFVERFGNAASRDHRWGWESSEAMEGARDTVARAAGIDPGGVIFTGGATEGINTVLRSYVGFTEWPRKSIITCVTEHDAVLAPLRYLAGRTGVAVIELDVESNGHVDLDKLRKAVERHERPMVVLMAANNETGTIHPTGTISEIARASDALFLCDTAQAFGKCAAHVDGWAFAVVSAHKAYGPKGIGALLLRGHEGELDPMIRGGGQERGLRGGTQNVPGIVGLGEALALLLGELNDESRRIATLRDRLEDGILAQAPQTWVNGDRANRLCNTSNIGFKGIDARTLIRDMHDIAVSTRSACSSGNSGPSHVLKAIGLSDEDAYSCIRFSLGRFTTEEEVDYATRKVVASAHKLRRSKSA